MRVKSAMYACLAALAVLCGNNLSAAEAGSDPCLGAGPENHGLRLKLNIATTREGATDVRTIHLDLFNVGTELVTLVALLPYEEPKGNYEDYFKSAVSLVTFPEVQPSGAQTAGASRKSPQPTVHIKPGDSLTVTWTARGHALKPDSIFDAPNTAPAFIGPGLYSVRARFLATTSQGREVLLTSNEEMASVDGSTQMPKYAAARLVAVDAAKQTAMIDLGAQHRIEKGDVFQIRYSLAFYWTLTITQVNPTTAEGTLESSGRPEGINAPTNPERGWKATLIPPKPTPEQWVKQIGASRLANDAFNTDARHFNATRSRTGDVSPEFWADAIRELKPARVYLHRFNLVVVLQARPDTEQGLYVSLPLSSFAPVGEVDGFRFTPIEASVLKFTRNLKSL